MTQDKAIENILKISEKVSGFKPPENFDVYEFFKYVKDSGLIENDVIVTLVCSIKTAESSLLPAERFYANEILDRIVSYRLSYDEFVSELMEQNEHQASWSNDHKEKKLDNFLAMERALYRTRINGDKNREEDIKKEISDFLDHWFPGGEKTICLKIKKIQ